MANTIHSSKPITDNITYVPCDAGVAISIGDLLYFDGTYAQPASAQADQLTPAANQALFASKFLGVANSARTGDETTDGEVAVITDRLFLLPCTSGTFNVGDKVAIAEAGSGTELENQKVVATTDEALAIGTVNKDYASATTQVWARLTSTVLGNSPSAEGDYTITVPILPHASLTEQNLLVAREALEVLSIDAVPDLVQGGALTGTVVKASGTATPASGTTPLHTGTINFNATAHTVQPLTLTSTGADLILAAGDRIGLDLSAALSTGRAVISIRVRRRR